jgi:hypothetical protein
MGKEQKEIFADAVKKAKKIYKEKKKTNKNYKFYMAVQEVLRKK